jgi:hypothetical protein
MTSRRNPTQQLKLHCSRCGVLTVRFESWVAEGQVYGMVGKKVSEMMDFLRVTDTQVLCTPCSEEIASEASNRRQLDRDRIRRQMQPSGSQAPPQTDVENPAIYDEEQISSLRPHRDNKSRDRTFGSWPRRSNTQPARPRQG